MLLPVQRLLFAKITPLAILCLLASAITYAQAEDLTLDTAFFNQQKAAYQDWLGQSGIGKVLKVEGMKVEKGHISLYLGLHYPGMDSIAPDWEGLKRDFEAVHPLGLEHSLFYKMAYLMEVWQSMADVQIYEANSPMQEPVFFRGIYFEDGMVKVVSSQEEFNRWVWKADKP